MISKIENHELWQVYNSWYEKNTPLLKIGDWRLTEKDILSSPEKDSLRGLNLIAFLDDDSNRRIDDLLTPLKESFEDSIWFLPGSGRHITVLDIIPHNSGKSIENIKKESQSYVESISKTLKAGAPFDIKISFSGLFASPDGLTLQGFPANAELGRLRDLLRKEIQNRGLANLEEKKYILNTAHIAIAKFFAPLNGNKLISIVDNLRRTTEIPINVKKLVFNVSSRYDKIKTIEIIKTWEI